MINNILSNCTLCPRNCHVNRMEGKRGLCGMNYELKVARAALHMWEEPCISGEAGSGTVFFSGCPLGCIYCQNQNIANGYAGKGITVERLSDIFMNLQSQGANNINLVTPTHYIPQIREAIIRAKEKGLTLPIVYNTSSYEKASSLRLLDGFIDIYLPDFKYWSEELGKAYSHASDYRVWAMEAIEEMYRQVGRPQFNEEGIMIKGIIVRHLLLPGYVSDSKQIINYLYKTYQDNIYISIMNQYTPLEHVKRYPEINRRVLDEEYDEVIDYAIELGVENGFIQEGDTAKDSFIPEFNGEGV